MRAFDALGAEVPFDPPEGTTFFVLPNGAKVGFEKRDLQDVVLLQITDGESGAALVIQFPRDIAQQLGAEMAKKQLIVVGG